MIVTVSFQVIYIYNNNNNNIHVYKFPQPLFKALFREIIIMTEVYSPEETYCIM
jgi:hypothetical protein